MLPGDIHGVFRLMQTQQECTSNQALMVLRCCGDFLTDLKADQRQKLVTEMWAFFEKMGIALDTSHYNALLKAQLENENDFVPTDFLAWMEKQGVSANRVTYQHLIAKYCQNGDIAGATTILEHMKELNMPVNEHVFHSLIIGHCRANDFESAKGVMAIMTESGLDVGSEAHMSYILGMAKAGKPWEEINAELEKLAQEREIDITDHDYFNLILELIRSGQRESAVLASEKLPKKTGYFQELRNAVTQMIFAGEIDLPFEILANFRPPVLASDRHDTDSRDHGLFFMRAMIIGNCSPEKMLETVGKFAEGREEGTAEKLMARVLAIFPEHNLIEQGQALSKLAVQKYGDSCLYGSHFSPIVRYNLSKLNSKEEIVNYLAGLSQVGVKVLFSVLANDVYPKLCSLTNDSPLDIVFEVRRAVGDSRISNPGLTWTKLTASMITYLLNLETQEAFDNTVSFVVSASMPPSPWSWTASLARSYLATGDLNNLVTMMAICSNIVDKVRSNQEVNKEELERRELSLSRTLVHIHSLSHRYHPDETPDQVVHTVLKELHRQHLGVHPEIVDELGKLLTHEEAKATLEELRSMYNDNDYWTREKVQEFMDMNRSKRRYEAAKSHPNFIPMNRDGYIDDKSFPHNIADMERMFGIMQNKGKLNMRLSKELCRHHVRDGNVDKAKEIIESSRKLNETFTSNVWVIDDIVGYYLKQDNVDAAVQFVEDEVKSGSKVFATTFVDIAIACAKKGEHSKVLDLLRAIDKDCLSRSHREDEGKRFRQIVDYYAKEQDEDNMIAVQECLKECHLVTALASKSSNFLAPFVSMHLSKGDSEAAVQAFEKFAKEEKRLPFKSSLMKALIEEEDMEKMQRVLDASIEVIGEERALYDLAINFLEMGKSSQARKLLATPGLRYNHEKVANAVTHLTENKRLEALEKFVQLTQPVFGCDREFLYTKLVGAYSDNAVKMNDIWVNMQEEGFAPSDALKLKMADAFRGAQMQVPFELPEHPTEIPEPRKIHRVVVKPNIHSSSVTKEQPSRGKITVDEYYTTLADGKATRAMAMDLLATLVDKNNVDTAVKVFLDTIVKDAKLLSTVNNIVLKLFGKLDLDQLENIRSQADDKLCALFFLDSRVARAKIDQDFGKFLDQVPDSETDRKYSSFISMAPHCKNSEQAERCAEVAVSVQDLPNGDYFALEVLKACVVSGQRDIAQRIVGGISKDALSKLNTSNMKHISLDDLEEAKNFFSASDIEMSKENMARLYNRLAKEKFEANNVQGGEATLKEALVKWTPLDLLTNDNLKKIIVGDFSQEQKDSAKSVLDGRKTSNTSESR